MKPIVAILSLAIPAYAGQIYEAPPRITPAPTSYDSGWEFSLAIYAPMMGLDGDIGVAGLAPTNVDLDFGDVWDTLDGAFSGAFEARYNRWSINLDAIWLKISADALPSGTSYLRFNEEELIASLSVGFDLVDTQTTTLDFLVGAAVTSLDVDLDLMTVPTAIISVSGSQEWIDPYIGLRFRQKLGERWTLFATGLYGGFDVSSDEYWQVIAGIGYQISERTTLALAYRIISVDYHQAGFTYDVDSSGPNLGLVFHF